MPTAVLAQPESLDLLMYRGDDGALRVTVTAPDGSPADVSGASWLCHVRAQADAAAILATLTVTPVPGDPSSVDVIVSDTISRNLPPAAVWDLQMTLGTTTQTLLAGSFKTSRDVSRVVIP